MPDTQILIVGGGASGLSAAGALRQYDLNATILDRDSAVGGTWARRYDRLHLHTIRALSHSAYYRIPKGNPRYLSRDQFVTYLREYAAHFDFDIQFNTDVTRIHKSDDSAWIVDVKDGESWTAQVVVVATGYNNIPYTPDWTGRDRYSGTFLHAIDYQTGRDYAGKRALVVGCGNTGTEICVDLIEQGAAHVAISIRTPPVVVPRDPFGVPVQVWGIPMSFLSDGLGDWVVNLLARVQLGDLTQYGMKKPAWGIFKDKRIPMIDVGFVAQLKAGKIHIHPDIQELTASGAIFTDGDSGEFDVVIAATGYRTGLQSLLDVPDVLASDGQPLVEMGEPTPHPGLYFVGLQNSPAGILMAARMTARKLAKHVAAYLGGTTA